MTGKAGVTDGAAGLKREGIEDLALTGGTKIGRTLPLHDLFDRRSTHAAWQPRAIIDEIVELEVTAFAITADEIAQRAAALLDRSGERDAHRGRQQIVRNNRDPSR